LNDFSKKLSYESIAQLLSQKLIPLALVFLVLWELFSLSLTLEPYSYDLLMRMTAKPATESPVVLVLIDDESVRRLEGRFGPLFWRQNVYLEIFQKIQEHKPAVMVFDSDVHDINRINNKAFLLFPSLVSGWRLEGLQKDSYNTYQWLYTLKSGIVDNDTNESDGTVRRQQRFIRTPAGMFPSLSVATAIEYLRVKRGEGRNVSQVSNVQPPSLLNNKEPLANAQSKWDNSFPEGLVQKKEFLIRWYQTHPFGEENYLISHPAIPLWKLFEPNQIPPGFFNNKIVMLGTASNIFRDHRKTSVGRRHLQVDIHATAIDNILQSETLSAAPDWQQYLIILGFFILVFMIRVRFRSFAKTMITILGIMAGYFYIALTQFAEHGWVLHVITPEAFMLTGLFLGTSYRQMADNQQVKAMELTVSQLVSQSVFTEIQRTGYSLEPGGQHLDITSVFIDIRNFSHLAESMAPEEVTQLLNEFYTIVEKITFHHRGTVDKFMGDGILLIFGAPIPCEDHADLAFMAAQEILEATHELTQRWWAHSQIWVETGISLSSGPAFVGFLGPIHKLEYTAIGDTVNLCVGLQAENKRFQTRMILSEFTVARLSYAQNLIPLDQIRVKGREGSVNIYAYKDPHQMPSAMMEQMSHKGRFE
jgi:class 3 adenylate cyclase/CHASE2 domain-containing sensor protein